MKWSQAAQWAADHQVAVLGCSETNQKWDKAKTYSLASISRTISKKAIVCASLIPNATLVAEFLAGGTVTSLQGTWSGRHTSSVEDSLGRWSGSTLRLNTTKYLTVITVYCAPKTKGMFTSHTRLQRQLQLSGSKLSPTDAFFTDLTKAVRKLRGDKHHIIVMGDFNHQGDSKELQEFQHALSLIDVHAFCHGTVAPETYQRGRHQIDFIFCSSEIAHTIHKSGFSTYSGGPFLSDHRALFVDLDLHKLMDRPPTEAQDSSHRTLYSTQPKLTNKYLDYLMEGLHQRSIFERVASAQSNTFSYSPEVLDQIDGDITAAMLDAEKRCHRSHRRYPWSPQVHLHWLISVYWKTQCKVVTTGRLQTSKLQQLLDEITQSHGDVHQDDHTLTVFQQEARAAYRLRKARKKSVDLRLEYLFESLVELGRANEERKKKAIRNIIRQEQKERCWRVFKQYTASSTDKSSVHHILHDGPNGTVSVDDTTTMEQMILQRNSNHFAQANGTPFTIPPLADNIDHSATNEFAQGILSGKPVTTGPTQEVLYAMQKQLDTLPDDLSFTDMIEGYKRWRESTSTSPSGRHLGHYRSVIFFNNIDVNSDNSPLPNYGDMSYEEFLAAMQAKRDQRDEPTRSDRVLALHHDMLTFALKHRHIYDRWRTVHSVMLEKQPGYPHLDKLRVIHLYECDWNLLQKLFVAKQLVNHAEQHEALQDSQWGCRKGRSANDLAFQKTLWFDYVRITRTNACNFDNDAKACFDRVVEPCSSLACQRLGLHPTICKLHSDFTSTARFHVKLGHGVSPGYIQHCKSKPIHGTGQGAGDSPARWGLISDILLKLYNDNCRPSVIRSLTGHHDHTLNVGAYVDDTNCFTIDRSANTPAELAKTAQDNARLWANYLHVSGGKLSLHKCSYHLLWWKFLSDGSAQLAHVPSTVSVINPESQEEEQIHQLATHEAYKTLGIYMSPDNSTNAEEAYIRSKVQRFTRALRTCNLRRDDATMLYNTVVAPSTMYSLPITQISWDQLEALFAPVTHAVLSRMGFNRHFPRAVCYAPISSGGLGLIHPGSRQGSQKARLLLQHLNTRSPIQPLLLANLEFLQQISGITTSLLSNPDVILPHLPSCWLTHLREYLRMTNAKVHITHWQPIPLREHDSTIMEHALTYTDDTRLLAQLNRCRIFLQVTWLSEICDADGKTVCVDAWKGRVLSSQSLLRWPRQNQPSTTVWKKWQQFLNTLGRGASSARGPTLRTPLGNWHAHHSQERTWPAYEDRSANLLFKQNGATWDVWERQTQRWGRSTYTNLHTHVFNLTEGATPSTLRDGRQVTAGRAPLEHPAHFSFDNHIEANTTVHQRSVQLDTVWLASDGSAGQFPSGAWALSTDTELIADGAVRLPLHQSNVSSYTAEAYAFLAAIRLLSSSVLENVKVTHYCDNLSLVNKVNDYRKRTYVPSSCREYPYLLAIVKSINALSPTVKYTARHVKGHQDRSTSVELLSREAQLNVHCDKLAGVAATHETHGLFFPLPHVPAISALNAEIAGGSVTSRPDHWLEVAANTQDLRFYLADKHGWDDTVFSELAWESFEAAVSRSRLPQTFLLKFLYGWLPLLTHPAQPGNSDCPTCPNELETEEHFLLCPSRESLWENLAHSVATRLDHHEVRQDAADLIIRSFLPTNRCSRVRESLPGMDLLIASQNKIGWNLIWKGRWSYVWSACCAKPLTDWLPDIQTIIWKGLHTIWIARNNSLHRSQQVPSAVATDITELYEWRQRTPQADDGGLFQLDLPVLLAKPRSFQTAWIAETRKYRFHLTARLEAQSLLGTRSLHYYFKTTTSTLARRVQSLFSSTTSFPVPVSVSGS